MSAEKPTDGNDLSGRPKREPPTIDLTATEIGSAPPGVPAEASEVAPAKAAAGNGAAPPPPAEPERKSRAGGPSMPLVGGAIAAALALLLLLAWVAGPFRGRDETAAAAAAANAARIAQLETQYKELASRAAPVAAAPDRQPVEALAQRLSRLESQLSERLGAADSAASKALEAAASARAETAQLADVVRDTRNRADAAAAHGDAEVGKSDLAALEDRLAAVERNAKAADAELAKRLAGAADDRAGRLAIAALSLRAAALRGDPFGVELGAVKALNADPAAIAALEPYAASGIVSAAALARELSQIVPKMQQAGAAPAADAGIIGKLQANAERLVRIRPIADVPGNDVPTVMGRLELKSAHDDIAGALAEIERLPEATRAAAADWIRKARAREAALAQSGRLAAGALSALGRAGL